MDAIVCISGGGLKAATAAARYVPSHRIIYLHVGYGQASAPMERRALRALTQLQPASSLVEADVPHLLKLRLDSRDQERESGAASARGERPNAESASGTAGLLPLLVALGAQCAMRVGAISVVTGLSERVDLKHIGVVSGTAFPDRLRALLHLFNLAYEGLSAPHKPVHIEAPLLDLAHAEMVKLARRLEVPLEHTWSCAQAGPAPCRRCDGCRTREQAFAAATMMDPLARREPSLAETPSA